ncbi:MAG: hypothetical protein U0271_19525 [Polyangiaceae bacterium]
MAGLHRAKSVGGSLLVAALLLFGCSRSEGGAGSGSARPGMSAPVEVDLVGGGHVVLDNTLLDSKSPDVSEDGQRGFWLQTVVPQYQPSASIEVEDAEGRRTQFVPKGGDPEGREPLVMVNREGGLKLALVHRQDPIPAFHGRGGNRGRSGDSSRVREVRRIILGGSPEPQ